MEIACHNIYLMRQDVCVLCDISWSFASKETHIITGRNGSGKTSFMRMLANITSPTSGHIMYDGQLFNADIRRRISYVPQDIMLLDLPLKTYCRLMGLSQHDTDYWLECAHLQHYKHISPLYLSGGEKQRFSIMMAIAWQADALLLDEPYNNLDDFSYEWLNAILYNNTTQTIIMILHHYHDTIFKDSPCLTL